MIIGASVALAVMVGTWLVLRGGRQETSAPATTVAPPVALVRGPAPRPTRRVGFDEGCVTAECHAAWLTAPSEAPSHVGTLSVVHAPVARAACDPCHGPDTGGHVYPLAHPKDQLCGSCHHGQEQRRFGHGAMSDDGCLACHDPHAGASRAILASATIDETCGRCHPRTDATVLHQPYQHDGCDSCHAPHGAENPALLLGGEGIEHCRLCHVSLAERVETAEHSHCGIEDSCLACHQAHGSERKDLMRAEPRELCVGCHATVGEAMRTATVSHDAVLAGDQCITCHEPHATDTPRMLRNDQPTICLSCHDKAVTASDGRTIPEMSTTLTKNPVVHGAVQHGDCSACHSIHGSTHADLLTALDSTIVLGAYDARNFALCFSCHDPNLAESAQSTQFRDGDRNLHEVHLRSATKPQGCAACHAVHSGDLPKLIASTVNFEGSGWAMPMGFEIRPDGGSCAPGCHEQLGYSRTPGGEQGRKGAARSAPGENPRASQPRGAQ